MFGKVRQIELDMYHGYVHDDPGTEEVWQDMERFDLTQERKEEDAKDILDEMKGNKYGE